MPAVLSSRSAIAADSSSVTARTSSMLERVRSDASAPARAALSAALAAASATLRRPLLVGRGSREVVGVRVDGGERLLAAAHLHLHLACGRGDRGRARAHLGDERLEPGGLLLHLGRERERLALRRLAIPLEDRALVIPNASRGSLPAGRHAAQPGTSSSRSATQPSARVAAPIPVRVTPAAAGEIATTTQRLALPAVRGTAA